MQKPKISGLIASYMASNRGKIEVYQSGSQDEYTILLNKQLVATAGKHLAHAWCLALARPEHHGAINRLYDQA